MIYAVILRRGEVRGYIAECPAIPGCVTQGRTKREVVANMKDAMLGCLSVLNERAKKRSRHLANEEVVRVTV